MLARQFDEMEDEYLRERKADLEQVVERLLARAGARAATASRRWRAARAPRDFAGEDPLVLVANDIAPADMLQFKGSVFLGFVTDVGGKTSHTAIVARSMDIPAVVGAREASRLIRQDDWIVIDGDAGVVIVDPSPIVLEEYRFRQAPGASSSARRPGAAAPHAGGDARRRARSSCSPTSSCRATPRRRSRPAPSASACSAASSCS